MQDYPYVLGFTAGELSPWLATRFDLQAYMRGAALLQNFLVQPYGGLCRRFGAAFVTTAAVQDSAAIRLVPFCFSESDALILELFPGGMRVMKHGEPVLNADGSVYTMSAPWDSAAEVHALHCTQVNDIVYITSKYRAPLILSRYADNAWACRNLELSPYPRETYLMQSAGLKVQMESSGAHALLTIEGSGPDFLPEMVNREMVIADAEVASRTLFLNQPFEIKSSTRPNLNSTDAYTGTVYSEHDSNSKMYNFYTVIRPYKKEYYNGNASAAAYPQYFFPGAMCLDNGVPYEVGGDWEIRTNGEWNAVWELWRSYDDYTVNLDFRCWQWTCIRTFEQNSFSERKNYIISGSEDVPCRMMLVCRSADSTSSAGAHVYFNILGGRREYKFLVSEYISPAQARGRLISVYTDKCRSFSTRMWSFGAFGPRNGYPTFSALHQGRLWFGGIAGLPTTLIASTVNDFNNFAVSSSDDAALHLTLSTANQNRICWLCPARELLVGITESEWTLGTADGSALSPTNASFVRQSSVGSGEMAAHGVENTVFYVQRGGRCMREISYKLTADGYTSTDMSLLAEHLFASGVRSYVVQRGRTTRLWVLMNDGTLAVLTTNAEQQVTAWQRMSMQGRTVCQLTALPGLHNTDDEVWLVVQNSLSGVVSIERIAEQPLFLDGAVTLQADSPLVAAPHLAGLRGYVYPAGEPAAALKIEVAPDGSFTIPNFVAGKSYTYGASYNSELQTMPLEDVRTYNTVRQEGRVRLRVMESDPAFSCKATHAQEWEPYDPERDRRSYPYSGEIRVSQLPEPGVGQGFALRIDGNLDFRLLSLTVEMDFHGR